MLPDRVSNPGPLTYESGALLIALRGPVKLVQQLFLYICPKGKGFPLPNGHRGSGG